MKKYTFVLFLLFATLFVKGQEVISSQGDTYTNVSGNIDFTIGEVITFTGNNVEIIEIEGYSLKTQTNTLFKLF